MTSTDLESLRRSRPPLAGAALDALTDLITVMMGHADLIVQLCADCDALVRDSAEEIVRAAERARNLLSHSPGAPS